VAKSSNFTTKNVVMSPLGAVLLASALAVAMWAILGLPVLEVG